MQQRRSSARSYLALAAACSVATLSSLESSCSAYIQPQRLSRQRRDKQGKSLKQHQQQYQPIKPLHMSTDEDDGWKSTPSKSAMIGGAGVNNAGEPPFEIRGFSLGNAVVGAGVVITLASFVDYLSTNSDSLSVSGLGFVYGLPIFLAGAALKYAEIEPVPVVSTAAGERAFDEKATETIQKIKQDVTRHRYGDEAHLDTTVKKLGLVVPGKEYPQLQELRQDVDGNGELAFTMVWQSVDTPYKMWADERRVKKYETFFGPGVSASVVKIDAEQRLVGIRLVTGSPQKEVTPVAAAASAAAAPAEDIVAETASETDAAATEPAEASA